MRTPHPWRPQVRARTALRSKRERLRQAAQQRRPMFAKLRQKKYLKARSQGNAAVVEFASRAQRIARVHQFGEIDAVRPSGPQYDYPTRELIGITRKDYDSIRNALLQHIGNKT